MSSDRIEISVEQVEKAFSLAWKVHKTPEKPYLIEKISKYNSSEIIFSFPASGSIKDWYSKGPFGETKVNLELFPSLKSIGNNETALVNEAFQSRFEAILAKSLFEVEVEKAMKKRKQIVFTGHSSGAPMAILATLWTLEKYHTPKSSEGIHPLCVTFGSPLIGNKILSHATRRENWSIYFLHYVTRYDIVPRILFSPLSSFDKKFEAISQFFNPKCRSFMTQSTGKDAAISEFYFSVMSNTATVTSHAACKQIEGMDATLETVSNFVPLSPYRPFGTYIFCSGNGKEGRKIVIRNPDAVLQLLFFSAQLSTEGEVDQVSERSLREHIINGTEFQQTLGTQNFLYLDQLLKVPLSFADSSGDINLALSDLGLSTSARLRLHAAVLLDERRGENEKKMKSRIDLVDEKMKELEKYKETWEHQKVGYYDAFKLQKDPNEGFQANVKRLELAAIWDEIIELLRKYDLPDTLEGDKDWIKIGTRFRKLVEPLDISNYYRHLRHVESGPYMDKGRPKRYRYTQRWFEHYKRKPEEQISESCFWAEVENLWYKTSNKMNSFEDVKTEVEKIEGQIKTWVDDKELDKDIFVEGSTLVKWWNSLPQQHRQGSCLISFIGINML
ncbi:hypothetical protein Lal_00030135 [Lupinus albus]|uniref:Putative carboxylesterase n=1 Tax=Lupinus albus TaxID=3870 RepID=A0A6A5MJK3_LUPAL|nr:putative carboxylesterase [Lupinus albus]KAF1870825.1 hypothetical protein Lal_00030135 [Lupinus albus]